MQCSNGVTTIGCSKRCSIITGIGNGLTVPAIWQCSRTKCNSFFTGYCWVDYQMQCSNGVTTIGCSKRCSIITGIGNGLTVPAIRQCSRTECNSFFTGYCWVDYQMQCSNGITTIGCSKRCSIITGIGNGLTVPAVW